MGHRLPFLMPSFKIMTQDLQHIILQSDRLSLRPVARDDADWICVRSNDYDIAKMTLSIPYPQTRDNVLQFLQECKEQAAAGTDHVYAIISAQPCGLIGFADIEGETAELGYWLSRTSWGHGYATEAAKTIVSFGFQSLGLKKITAGHFFDNPASGRVLEKLGFYYTGEVCNLACKARKTTVKCKQMVLHHEEWRKQIMHDNNSSA